MIYGARLLEKARSFQITDSVFRANLDEQMKQCVFYDVLLGFKSMDTLTRSNNVWAAMAPGRPVGVDRRWAPPPSAAILGVTLDAAVHTDPGRR